jgi:hypothetical protein
MGYTTEFRGALKFVPELNARQLAKVKSFFGEDVRKHPEWGRSNLYYIHLAFLDDFSGIEWDGTENSYDMVEQVNLIIKEMRKEWPEFGLEGKFLAQGEDIEDRWELQIADGWAVEKKMPLIGQKVRCPHCHNDFTLEA